MSAIELTPAFRPRPIRHVFMDWDGTTALTRGGWSDIMVELFAEMLPFLPGENDASIRILARDELMRLNGRPSIHQMARLSEMVEERGGVAGGADDYQRDYQSRVARLIESRLARVQAGDASPDSLLVPGVRAFFTELNERGIAITLASGTPLPELLLEVRLLGLEHHFAAIHGPADLEDRTFAKRDILQLVLRENGLEGPELIAFGDGPVELIETLAIGGLAVAVATDEAQPGCLDTGKRDTLLAVGSEAVIADFTALSELLAAFFP
jgi:phosphoglycolate phosphatase-like HAD superfamily hydrolase